MLALFFDGFVKIWIAMYWKLILACAIIMLVVVLTIKFLGKGSFDDNPSLSPQEIMKSISYWAAFILGSSVAGVLLYSYFT